MVRDLGLPFKEYASISPTYTGKGSTLAAQVPSLIGDLGWDVLIFEALDGHQADYAPGSTDLGHVVDLLTRFGEPPCPPVTLRRGATPPGVRRCDRLPLLRWWRSASHRLEQRQRHRRRRSGAAYWVIWLIASGHDPSSAERWAAKVPARRSVPVLGITAFAKANVRVWAEIGGREPDDWTRRLINAADL